MTITAAALAITLTGACGIGDKQQQAGVIAAARAAAVRAGSATGTVRLQNVPKKTSSPIQTASSDGAGLAGLAGGKAGASLAAPVAFDFVAGRTGVTVTVAPPAPPPTEGDAEAAVAEVAPPLEGPTVVFWRDTAFVQRVNRRPAERRAWGRLDFGGLPNDERSLDQSDFTPAQRLEALGKSLNPAFIVDLAVGTLAGSVERVGTESVDGTPTTHYRGNVSLEKANTELDLSDDAAEARARVFRLVGIRRDVNPADYWITPEGQLRRARFRFEQRLFPQVRDALTITVDLQQLGGGAALTIPPPDQTIRLSRYARFVRTAVARTDS